MFRSDIETEAHKKLVEGNLYELWEEVEALEEVIQVVASVLARIKE